MAFLIHCPTHSRVVFSFLFLFQFKVLDVGQASPAQC